ncbi:unnamed protein product [Rotaria socialis]|uniref:Uncharacterized protein n=1 Tax=Rotaria socialis TaxID=392032 RepID=A0A818VLK2_9BILA|nr:unnamed protein product [Rotaria socialis]
MSSSNDGEGFLNLKISKEGKLVAQDPHSVQSAPVSSRFGWSTHNCGCTESKTGLVLYPNDVRFKNIVLLVCAKCYGYTGRKTQHQELADWYYGIYGDSKSFSFTSGFSQKGNNELGFNSSSMNCNTTSRYHTIDRTMGELEQEAVRKVVRGQLNSFDICSTSTRYSEARD